MARGSEQTHFGFDSVPLEDKQQRVDDVFHSVARRYDLMNDLMSGGLHRAWKDALVTAVNPPRSARDFALLDLAGGTGDVAFRVVEAGGAGTRVTVCDINRDMLEVGRKRADVGSGGAVDRDPVDARVARRLDVEAIDGHLAGGAIDLDTRAR